MGKRLFSQQDFVERVKRKCGNALTFEKTVYSGTQNPVTLTCILHGDFTSRALDVLAGHGCRACGYAKTRKTTQHFIKDAQKIHGDKYHYVQTQYMNNVEKVAITCPTHGEFLQAPQSHLRGHGCPTCALKRTTPGLYCPSYFSVHGKETGHFYVVEMTSDKERFVKIGITKQRKIQDRFGSRQKYKIKVLLFEPMLLKNAYEKEQYYKHTYKQHRYEPLKKFIGHTECFTTALMGCGFNVK